MIRDVSETLRAVLDDPELQGSHPELFDAHILFDRPDESFNPQGASSVNLFLFDVSENVSMRDNQPVVERANGRAKIHQPPRRVDCCYLVTAWPVGGEDPALQEHRILSQAMQVLARYPTIPAKFLKGSLVSQELPLPAVLPPIEGMKNPADFWTAVGNQLRASFVVTVTIEMPVYPAHDLPQVTEVNSGFDTDPASEGPPAETRTASPT